MNAFQHVKRVTYEPVEIPIGNRLSDEDIEALRTQEVFPLNDIYQLPANETENREEENEQIETDK